ncbi:hypothetical protein J2Z32_002043 [Paenibacillus turicensis]|uniref:Alpha/beta hydrolase n=1 Tax=Paenibacillus turicensis TaxID=160487 RepID=A0ABS4FSV3_9BACL|nr:hypothetical protein [Paenibacillus turicensis]MBP1905413.1 hypothetical protein [Paenibacillus turicensis]
MRRNWAKTIFIVGASSFLLINSLNFTEKTEVRDTTNQSNIINILFSHGGGSGGSK